MNLKRLLFIFTIPLLTFCLPAIAQDKMVTGKVTDAKDGSALQNATVQVKGTKVATQTGADGTFKIKVSGTSNTLVISSVGYSKQEASIGAGNVMVSLTQTNTSLNEVVVVAYGTRRRGDLTGSVTSVSAKDFQKGNIASPEQLLQGKVAGLQVTTGGGSAGGGSMIRIRGGASLNSSNDPLIVIDGVPVDGNGIDGSNKNLLGMINPNDIESMSVLKDASATALYGSRASNGVIIVTTKKGVKGKMKFNYSSQFVVGTVAKKINVFTGDEIRDIVTKEAAATGNNTYKNLLGTANTNWQDQILQSTFSTDNNISASGAIANIPFRASFGHLGQSGSLVTNNYSRLSSALNLSPKLFKDALSINLNLKGSTVRNSFADEGAIGSAVAFDPTQPVYANNKFGGFYEWSQPNGDLMNLATRNPLALLALRNNKTTVNRFIGNVQLDYKLHFFPDLHLQANLGYDYTTSNGNDITDSSAASTNSYRGGKVSHYEQKKKNSIAELSLFYSKDIKSINSKIDVLVLHGYQDFVTEVSNFASFTQRGNKDTIPNSTPTFATDKPTNRLESYLGRINYSYAGKYLITASIRRDASSKFSPLNRVAYFPAVALAWKLSEDFFKGNKVINELKVRASYGTTGQQDGLGLYDYLPRYSYSTNSAQYQFGNTYYNFLRPSAYDPTRKWESTTTNNVGLDFTILGNRISGSVDYYNRKTKDLLALKNLAPGSNFDIQATANVGNTESDGVEFTLNTTPIRKANFSWDFGFNIAYNHVIVTNLLDNPDPNFKGFDVTGIDGGTGNNIGKLATNYAPYVFNVFKQVYDKTSGKPIEGLYEDVNRDGKIDDLDRVLYKKPAHDVLLGANTQITCHKWTLGVSAHGSFGGYLYNNYFSNNGTLNTIQNPVNFVGNGSRSYLETGFKTKQYLSDYYIENASFFRLDNINIGYNVGKISNRTTMRLAASVQNVFVVTKYKGTDPEVASDGGKDSNIYPRPRIYSLAFNFDF